MTLNVNHVDIGNDIFDGTLNLNDGGDVAVDNAANLWRMNGTLNKNGSGTSTVSGDAVTLTGAVNVNAGTLSMPTTTLSPNSTLVVNGLMILGQASVLAGPASVTGSGTLRMSGTSTTTANTTIAVNTFDWDGIGIGTLHTINSGVNLTINSPNFDDDGDMDDPISLAGDNGTLTVNGPASWEMRGAFNANSTGLGISHINGSSRMILVGATGVMTVNGQTIAAAPLTFGSNSTVNISIGAFLRLTGGDLFAVVNQMAGGVINGPGTLSAPASKTLRGFGTIGALIDFDGSAAVLAQDGTLTINGSVVDVGLIGTFDGTGILNIPAAWNSAVADDAILNGGELKGGTITVANATGIRGKGLVSSRIINNANLIATLGTLVFETAANDNDWDGAGNNGLLGATDGSTLELRDNATFGFTGVVGASGGSRVFTSGFALDFNPGSTLNLTGSKYQSTSSTDLGGAVNISPGGESTLEVAANHFLTFEPTSVTTLADNLRLVNNNARINAGATFSGAGALIVSEGSHLILDNSANANVLLVNRGTIRPAGFDAVGLATVKEYQQFGTGGLFIELTGTLLNQFDRVAVGGQAILDGYLNLDIDGPFVPALGNTFNILTASSGVFGHFTAADVSGMPPGLTFQLNYLPNAVQVAVISGGPYETWISLFPSLTNPADRLKSANPDGDGYKNLAEFALDGDPTTGTGPGKIVAKIAPVGGSNVLTLTFPVRIFALPVPADPVGNDFIIADTYDGITYTVLATDDLPVFAVNALNVTEVTGGDAVAIQAGLPALNSGWGYRTFRCPNSIVGNPADFMKVSISD